jgi:hypothetical protein
MGMSNYSFMDSTGQDFFMNLINKYVLKLKVTQKIKIDTNPSGGLIFKGNYLKFLKDAIKIFKKNSGLSCA